MSASLCGNLYGVCLFALRKSKGFSACGCACVRFGYGGLMGCGMGELLNRESEEHAHLSAYLIKDKFIYVHLLKGVILSGTGARHSSKSRCEPPSQSVASPKCLEVPRERNGSCSMNHGAKVNIACYPIRKIKHVNPSFNCWVFCCLNSVWLQAALRQIELQCASKSSNSQWASGRGGGGHTSLQVEPHRNFRTLTTTRLWNLINHSATPWHAHNTHGHLHRAALHCSHPLPSPQGLIKHFLCWKGIWEEWWVACFSEEQLTSLCRGLAK